MRAKATSQCSTKTSAHLFISFLRLSFVTNTLPTVLFDAANYDRSDNSALCGGEVSLEIFC